MNDYIFKDDFCTLIDKTALEMLMPVFNGESVNEIVATANMNEGIRSMALALKEKLKKGEENKDEQTE